MCSALAGGEAHSLILSHDQAQPNRACDILNFISLENLKGCRYYGNIANKLVKAPTKAYDVKTNSPTNTNVGYKKYVICVRQTNNTLYYNAEDLTEEQQAMFVERELDHIKTSVKENDIKSISFNFIHENIFRSYLNMPIRRLGFDSFFQRYNDDKGLAIFFVKEEKEIHPDNMGAYNRRAYAKQAQGLF